MDVDKEMVCLFGEASAGRVVFCIVNVDGESVNFEFSGLMWLLVSLLVKARLGGNSRRVWCSWILKMVIELNHDHFGCGLVESTKPVGG